MLLCIYRLSLRHILGKMFEIRSYGWNRRPYTLIQIMFISWLKQRERLLNRVGWLKFSNLHARNLNQMEYLHTKAVYRTNVGRGFLKGLKTLGRSLCFWYHSNIKCLHVLHRQPTQHLIHKVSWMKVSSSNYTGWSIWLKYSSCPSAKLIFLPMQLSVSCIVNRSWRFGSSNEITNM